MSEENRVSFDTLKQIIGGILAQDLADGNLSNKWSIQGLGMYRRYLDPKKDFQINIWDPMDAYEGASMVHTHPWNFTSYVLGGCIIDEHYHFTESLYVAGQHWKQQKIECGEGGGPIEDPVPVKLEKIESKVYTASQDYTRAYHP